MSRCGKNRLSHFGGADGGTKIVLQRALCSWPARRRWWRHYRIGRRGVWCKQAIWVRCTRLPQINNHPNNRNKSNSELIFSTMQSQNFLGLLPFGSKCPVLQHTWNSVSFNSNLRLASLNVKYSFITLQITLTLYIVRTKNHILFTSEWKKNILCF